MSFSTASPKRGAAGLLAWLALCLAAESTAVVFLPGRWYAHLHKASWTPPSYLFGPVWTCIYILMGIAAWLVWREGGFRKHRLALFLFLAQLVSNAAWSFICFGLHNLPLSVLDMVLFMGFVGGNHAPFFRRSPWRRLVDDGISRLGHFRSELKRRSLAIEFIIGGRPRQPLQSTSRA